MSNQDVFPVRQGFPRPPDGGEEAPTTSEFPSPVSQAFKPAPLAYPFPSVPTPPKIPFNPVLQAFAPVPVAYTLVPPALEVDVAKDAPSTLDAPTYVVSEVGNLPTTPQDSTRSFTIAVVVDYDTNLPPVPGTVNLLITLDPASKPLNTFGAQLDGRTIYFTTGGWIPPQTTPQRPMLTYGPLAFVVPDKDAAGVSLTGLGGPIAGNQIALNVAVGDGEVVTDLRGLVQDIVPQTNPLLDENGVVETKLPVQNVIISAQIPIGTPVDHFPEPKTVVTSEGPTQSVEIASQTGVIGIPVDHRQSIHL
jgi:hypothetical protein